MEYFYSFIVIKGIRNEIILTSINLLLIINNNTYFYSYNIKVY